MKVVYDIETLSNFFSYTDIDENENVSVFVVCAWRNDLPDLLGHLSKRLIQIGFNNLAFDSIVLAYMIENKSEFLKKTGDQVAARVYSFVQNLIKDRETASNHGLRPKHKQIDLFKINHYDNKARSTSLKALQCHIYWPNVQDMPFGHDHTVQPSEMDEILGYNLNDVLSTKAFYELCHEKINIRDTFTKLYGKDFTNKSDVSIGEEIFVNYIKQESGFTKNDLKERTVKYDAVNLGRCVLPYIKFNSPQFSAMLEEIKKTIVTPFRKFKQSIRYKDFIYDFGVGGIHGCAPAGVYEAGDGLIIDYDVKSYYPNLSIQNDFHPGHIPKEVFCKVYNNIFEERVRKQKEGKDAEQAGLKLSLNGIFGKSGEETSAFFDRYFFYKITLNGQLSLAMLAEAFVDFVPGLRVLQINTDGLTVWIPKDQEVKCEQILEKFMQRTKLIMEKVYYNRMFIRDVNNYIGEYVDKKLKKKGIFETSKEYHKDNSFLAVPKALVDYFVNGIPIEQSLKANNNIYDFCGRYKATSGWYAEYHTTKKQGQNIVLDTTNYGKILRFYPTTDQGGTAIKKNKDGRIINLLSGWPTKPFNKYEEKNIEDYKIDYDYFIVECNKIIDEIEPKQLTLF